MYMSFQHRFAMRLLPITIHACYMSLCHTTHDEAACRTLFNSMRRHCCCQSAAVPFSNTFAQHTYFGARNSCTSMILTGMHTFGEPCNTCLRHAKLSVLQLKHKTALCCVRPCCCVEQCKPHPKHVHSIAARKIKAGLQKLLLYAVGWKLANHANRDTSLLMGRTKPVH